MARKSRRTTKVSLRSVLNALKPKKMVLAHLGGWQQWDEVSEYLAGTDAWLDTAFIYDYISVERFLEIAEKHDKKKILFATDSPWSDAAKGIAWMKGLPLTTEEKEDILSGNAKRLLESNKGIR